MVDSVVKAIIFSILFCPAMITAAVFSHLGCFNLHPSNIKSFNTTLNTCLDYCTDYPYFGIQNTTCDCLNISFQSEKVHFSECNINCKEDILRSCGGFYDNKPVQDIFKIIGVNENDAAVTASITLTQTFCPTPTIDEILIPATTVTFNFTQTCPSSSLGNSNFSTLIETSSTSYNELNDKNGPSNIASPVSSSTSSSLSNSLLSSYNLSSNSYISSNSNSSSSSYISSSSYSLPNGNSSLNLSAAVEPNSVLPIIMDSQLYSLCVDSFMTSGVLVSSLSNSYVKETSFDLSAIEEYSSTLSGTYFTSPISTLDAFDMNGNSSVAQNFFSTDTSFAKIGMSLTPPSETNAMSNTCEVSGSYSVVINSEGKPLLMSRICRDVIVVTNDDDHVDEQKSEIKSSISKILSVSKESLSSTKNKKISVEDPRPSAQAVGYLGIIFFIIPIMIIVASDLPYILNKILNQSSMKKRESPSQI